MMDLLSQFGPTLLLSFTAALATYLIAPSVIRFFQSKPNLLPPQSYPRLADRLFLLIAIAALIGLPAQVIHNYNGFGSYFDFYTFDSRVRTIMQGGFSLDVYRFNPILVAIVPLYALWSDPRMMLLLQAVGFAVTAFPLYWYARQKVGRWLALTIAFAYLASPSVAALNVATFYEIKLSVPLLAFAIFFLLRRRYIPFLVCLGVCLLVKQEVAFTAIGFAAFIFLIQRNFILGSLLTASGAALAFVVLQLLPSSAGGVYRMFDVRYAYLGNSFAEVLQTLFFHPEIPLQHMLEPAKIDFALRLLSPVALLPLVGLEVTAISFPAWAYTLLSTLEQQFDPGQYYQAPLVPFIFFGSVAGLARLIQWNIPEKPTTWNQALRRKGALMVLLLASSQLYLPSSWARVFDLSSFTLSQHNVLGHQLMQQIPTDVSIIAQTELFMPLYTEHENKVGQFDPSINYTGGVSGWFDKVDENQEKNLFLFGDSTRLWYTVHQEAWEHWRASGYFETVVEEDGYFLLRRRQLPQPGVKLENGWTLYQPPSNPSHVMIDNGWALIGYTDKPSSYLKPLSFSVGDNLTLLGFATVPGDSIRGGRTLNAVAEWRAKQDIHNRYVILAHLVDAQGHVWAQDDREPIIPTDGWKSGDIVRDQYTFILPRTMPPGNYQVTFGVWDSQAEKSLDVSDARGQPLGISTVVSQIAITKDTGSIPANYLPIEQPIRVDMREVRLLGSTSIPQTVALGNELPVGLYWRALEKPRGDYSVSIQLRDASGRVALEQSDRPAVGAYPTTLWQPGEILLDWHDLTVPADFKTGDYALVVVLRDAREHTELGEAKIGQVAIGK